MNMKCMNDQSIQFFMFTLVDTPFVLFLFWFLVDCFTVFSIKSLIYLKRVNKTKHKEKIDKNDCCNSQTYKAKQYTNVFNATRMKRGKDRFLLFSLLIMAVVG